MYCTHTDMAGGTAWAAMVKSLPQIYGNVSSDDPTQWLHQTRVLLQSIVNKLFGFMSQRCWVLWDNQSIVGVGKGHKLSESGFLEQSSKGLWNSLYRETEEERQSIIWKAKEKQRPENQPCRGLPSFVHVLAPTYVESFVAARPPIAHQLNVSHSAALPSSSAPLYGMQCCVNIGFMSKRKHFIQKKCS